MASNQSQQAFGHTQQGQLLAAGTFERQRLAAVSPAERASIHLHSLVRSGTIYILSDGTFSKLDDRVKTSLELTSSLFPGDALALEAAQVFYSQNEFAISISTLPNFVSWTVSSHLKPSDVITRLAILYGPPTNPGGGNIEPRPLLSMPSLRSLRLIFQDYEFKGLGPGAWLKPSLAAIVELKARTGLDLRLQLTNTLRGLDAESTDIDADNHAELRDITRYLEAPMINEERTVAEYRRIVDLYRGPQSSHVNILEGCGWSQMSAVDAHFVVSELAARVCVKEWIEQERLNMLASQDVVMGGVAL